MEDENKVLSEKLERLYMSYIEVEKYIKRLREIKEQYSYKSMYTKLKSRKRAAIAVENDMQRDSRFEEMTKGCRRFNLRDSFWTKVSETFGTPRNECYNKWINEVEDLDRRLTKKDLEAISSMVRDGKDWLEISMEISCSPFKVFVEYIRSDLNPRPKMWTEEEDRLLEQGVGEYGASKWRFVSRIVGTKTGKECAMRFYFLNKNIKKGKWSEEEEKRLIEAVEGCGEGDWRNVSNYVMTRNPIQCRSKYLDEVKGQKKTRK